MERKSKRVLIVEGDRELRYMLSAQLISVGYAVYGAESGSEALKQMEKHAVDVVLTGYHMAKMDGLEFLSVCRVRWPGTPVIVFSAEQDDLAHEAVARGAFAWVRKDCEFTLLLEILTHAVQRSAHV